MVAAQENIFSGIVMLSIYPADFAVPMLLFGYFSQRITGKIKTIVCYPVLSEYLELRYCSTFTKHR